MSYVWAAYLAVFGCIGVYAARLFIRARAAAAKVLSRESSEAAIDSSTTQQGKA